MIQDATDQQIKAIHKLYPLDGKTVLEVGCGKGRVTRDLAKFAARVIASDPDDSALKIARTRSGAAQIEYIHAPNGLPELPEHSVDLVIYTLSLHHVPAAEMQTSLLQAGSLLKSGGAIMVLEPADGGSFNEAKKRFNVGSGDEGPLKEAAQSAMQQLPGWKRGEDHFFLTEFLFSDEEDFFNNKLPHFKEFATTLQEEILDFLKQHRTERGIILTSERRINLLRPETLTANP